MRRDLRATRRTRPSLTPLIDVVFLLLIFFMIVSKPMKDQQYNLTLSGQGQSVTSKIKEKNIDIKLQPDELISYGGKTYSLKGFKEELLSFKNQAASGQAGLQIQIYLALEGGVTLQETVKVMEFLQIAMSVKVSLVTSLVTEELPLK